MLFFVHLCSMLGSPLSPLAWVMGSQGVARGSLRVTGSCTSSAELDVSGRDLINYWSWKLLGTCSHVCIVIDKSVHPAGNGNSSCMLHPKIDLSQVIGRFLKRSLNRISIPNKIFFRNLLTETCSKRPRLRHFNWMHWWPGDGHPNEFLWRVEQSNGVDDPKALEWGMRRMMKRP